MKNAVKLVSLLLCLTALLSLCACGGGKIRTDVKPVDIADAIVGEMGIADAMTSLDENYITGRMDIDLSNCAEYDVRLSTASINVNEFGVFKAKDVDHVEALDADVQAYLAMRLETWMDEYLPEEKPKVENAQVRTFGPYVIYTILSESDSKLAIDTASEMLTK